MRLYAAVFGGGQLRALCVSAVILPFLRVLRFFSDVSSSVKPLPVRRAKLDIRTRNANPTTDWHHRTRAL